MTLSTVAPGYSVAALFVSPKGPYWGRPDVDAWDEERDARDYRGLLPVVAHPPCGRLSKLAAHTEARYPGRFPIGVDGGCFASALQSVFAWGGVLEHPAESKAWDEYSLPSPKFGKWFGFLRSLPGRRSRALAYVTEVMHVDYGHEAQKRTWLLYVGINPPAPMVWQGRKASKVVGFCTNNCDTPLTDRLGSQEASRTPEAFAECLISLARNCGGTK